MSYADSQEARAWARRVADTVPCPSCRAVPGAPCRSWRGELLDPHPSRVAAGVKAAQK